MLTDSKIRVAKSLEKSYKRQKRVISTMPHENYWPPVYAHLRLVKPIKSLSINMAKLTQRG